jgi:uncharacterized protein
MKLVLDTNVFVSGIFFNGAPFHILQGWRIGKVQLVVSPEILEEYRRVGEVLAGEHPAINIEPMLDYLLKNVSIFSSPGLPERVCDDPDNDKFFACALANGINLIVSGDKHLLSRSGYRKIEVLKPRDFLDRYLSG